MYPEHGSMQSNILIGLLVLSSIATFALIASCIGGSTLANKKRRSGTGAAAPDAANTKNRNGCSRSLNGVVMPDMEKIAGELYEFYCAEVGGKAYNGDPLPKWDAFRADPAKRKQSDAWVKVAEAAFDLAGHASLAAKRAEA